MKKRAVAFLLAAVLTLFGATGLAERKVVVKDQYYIGAMRVVRCREWVSLRSGPYKTSKQLAKVPLDSIVLYATNNEKAYDYSPYKAQISLYIRCEYEGQQGYILKKYLEPAPEFEPAETTGEHKLMTREEIMGSGETVFEWKEFNVSVLAAYERTEEEDSVKESLRVGCFIDDEPTWGYEETVKAGELKKNLRAFMGGTEDEPQVYVYDAEYGLIMLDLMEGVEKWTLSREACSLGDCAVTMAGVNTGVLYVTGSDGPWPLAITPEGNVLWRSSVNDPEVYGPLSIKLNPHDIEVRYESGKLVRLEYNGELIGVEDIETAP